MALVECAAPAVLTGQAHGRALAQQRAVCQQFRRAEIHRLAALRHLHALLHQLFDFGVNGEARRHAHHQFRNRCQFFRRHGRIHFHLRIVNAAVKGIPIGGKLPERRIPAGGAGARERGLQFTANLRSARRGVNLVALRVGFPHPRQGGDAAVAHGLRGGGVVNLTVAVASIADQVQHHVTVKLVAILHRPARGANGGVGSSALT